jgi:hypothetical protein
MKVAPLFTPIIIACSLNAIAGISNSQLCSLNRVGTSLGFMIAAGVLAVVGVYIGWQFAGVVGVAYGYLGSRVALLVQDLYVIRLVNARGWLSGRTWLSIGIQNLIAGGFALTYLAFPRDSFWLLVPSALHGGLMAAWLLRQPFRHIAGGFAGWRRVRTTPAQKGAAGS